jgi:hypothetical protein
MNINQELVEKIEAGRHCIEMPTNQTEENFKQVQRIAFLLPSIIKLKIGHSYYRYEAAGMWGMNNPMGYIPIPLSSFFLPTPKMIPVEELERLIINRDVWLESFDDHKKGMNALFDKLQEKINKYK